MLCLHSINTCTVIKHWFSFPASENTLTLADFKYCVTFNTHGNTNRSVYPIPSTQCKMLTSRPTQMLAMVLHFLKTCVLLDQIMFVIVKKSNMLGRWYLTISLFHFIDTYDHSYQIFHWDNTNLKLELSCFIFII